MAHEWDTTMNNFSIVFKGLRITSNSDSHWLNTRESGFLDDVKAYQERAELSITEDYGRWLNTTWRQEVVVNEMKLAFHMVRNWMYSSDLDVFLLEPSCLLARLFIMNYIVSEEGL